jgi:hypothetical protein
MSRVTNLNRYPRVYLDLADRFENGEHTIVLGPFTSKAAAANQRLDLYSFRSSLEASEFRDDYPRLQAIRMYVSAKAPWTLTLRHADALPALKTKAR